MFASNPFKLAGLLKKMSDKTTEYVAYYLGYNEKGKDWRVKICVDLVSRTEETQSNLINHENGETAVSRTSSTSTYDRVRYDENGNIIVDGETNELE